jgi:hypothetical protein
MINVPLLRKELEYITAHPEEHDQLIWLRNRFEGENRCGTAGCLAGNAVLHAGRVEGWTDVKYDGRKYVVGPTRYFPSGGSWTDVGAELFGLNTDQAIDLFDETNTLRRMWRLANRFTYGEIEIPPEFSG